jgi:hypothetical protein
MPPFAKGVGKKNFSRVGFLSKPRVLKEFFAERLKTPSVRYWLKENQNRPEIWNEAKKLF